MDSTIESFVAKLQADGVEAGRKKAEGIRNKAQSEAEQILSDARAEATAIREQAEKEAAQTLARAQSELEVAVRDTISHLRAQLNAAISEVLANAAVEPLRQTSFLTEIIHQIIVDYNGAQLRREPLLSFNVTPAQHDKLFQWVLGVLARENKHARKLEFDMLREMKKPGFEFRVDGAVVEVTQESIAGALHEIVSPRLRHLIDNALAVGEKKRATPADGSQD